MAATKPTRHPLVQQNLLDKAITYFAPKLAQQRMMARAQIAMVGGYTGARNNRPQLGNWNPGGGSPTTDAVADLPALRERSRDETRNNGLATGALSGAVTGSVGTGLTGTPAIDFEALGLTIDQAKAWNTDTGRRFGVWAGSEDCDVARTNDFYTLQQLGKRTWLESGDGFVITPRITRAGRTRLALQLIEGDRCCNTNRSANTPTLIEGIELDPTTQEPIAYHFADRHPGDLFAGANTWTRVVARGGTYQRRNVLHLFNPLRPGQVRGMPMLAPVIEPLKQIGKWTDNELNAAVTSSIFAVFAKMDAEAFQQIFDGDGESEQLIKDRSKWSGALDSGKAINLLPGEELGSVASTRPNPLFDPFWMAMVRTIGMALEIPVEVLTMHFQSSYSAARGALLMAWRTYKGMRDRLAKKMCQPVYELWLADEVAEGRIIAPGFFADDFIRAAWCKCLWTGDGPGSIDPTKEIAAAEGRVNLGISTLAAESILYDGIDWETKHRQRVVEVNAQKADGIYIPPAGSPAAPPEPGQADDGTQPAPNGGPAP